MKYFVYCRKSSEEEDRQVQSIDSQQRELARLFGAQDGIDILDTLKEAQSAMTLGRPIFGNALDRIERGEADGLIAWAPDRLARNSVDGGKVIYLLDAGKLKDLKFATFTFENTPSGKFMLSILFGQSKYYSDALSENVRRGIRTKLENGWLPSMAKIGYLNDPTTRTIVPDPERFPLLRQMWELMISGAHSVREIHQIMADRGLRTFQRKREGGRPLAPSAIYSILTNPFYAGMIPWKGRLYPGKHPPVVTMDEFEAVQGVLRRPAPARPRKLDFAFTGLMKCGECGFSVTAEEKTNRFGSKYTYYHCSKRRLDYDCKQASVELKDLESQIEAFLLSIRIHPDLHAFALECLHKDENELALVEEIERRAIQAALTKSETARRNLTRLRIAGRITDAEFEAERQELDREHFRLETQKNEAAERRRFEPGALCTEFSVFAAKWFREGDNQTKRTIVEIVGSNPVLIDKKLRINASKLFRHWQNIDSIPAWRGLKDEVRTLTIDPEVAETLRRMHYVLEKQRRTTTSIAA
jgi:site-specific DNA recombinase